MQVSHQIITLLVDAGIDLSLVYSLKSILSASSKNCQTNIHGSQAFPTFAPAPEECSYSYQILAG
jgi:hypothetical protein